MALDVNVFDKLKNFGDYKRLNDEFEMRKLAQQQALQSGAIDAQSKANTYATQVISAATATGDQNAYNTALQHLQGNGIDTSTWAPDVQTAAQQAQAAKIAQSSYGALINAGLKVDANNIARAGLTGDLPPAVGISSFLPQISQPTAPQPQQSTAPVNNPGNLRPVGATEGFRQFATPEEGYAALNDDLMAKVTGNSKAMGGKPPTIANIISTYAPPSENDTNSYIMNVVKSTGLSPDKVLTPDDVKGLMDAIVKQEGNSKMLAQISPTAGASAGVPQFVPPAYDNSKTKAWNDTARNQAFEEYKMRPDVLAAQAGAKTKAEAEAKKNAEVSNDLSDREASLPQLEKTAAKLSELGKKASYTMLDKAGDFVVRETKGFGGLRSPATEGAINRGEYVSLIDNQILPLLRQTFGAQFTEQEGKSLKATLGDPNKSPEEKDAVLRSFIDQKKETINTLRRQQGLPPTKDEVTPVNNGLPKMGETRTSASGTYLFNGGDPADKNNWKKVK